MRTLVRRMAATALAVALLLWGSGELEAEGARLWVAYGAMVIGAVLGYYALTGRAPFSSREG